MPAYKAATHARQTDGQTFSVVNISPEFSKEEALTAAAAVEQQLYEIFEKYLPDSARDEACRRHFLQS